ncbi:MAG: hypothetical protein F2681_13930 [Actinobacteria bacterium]|uniref:Unannotated protein n=1 Tax=freshwater metagenome TaxID=449393 RepID=A0A6J6AAL8_9ZZZZ|nr:hypothetical protein [Actinomycetota bacterium]MSW78975.1 hypothetical protein [Actinomycetota bacterium]MSX56446.1 hypothetical protein [Actinomycetota bacterium]MSX94016.1 hypothetical protein [Actinomycetota bacterium]MSZ84234.1 hypothetical protein [Actinomycetota bacterium]
MTRLPRLILPLAFGLALLAGCSGDNPYQAAKTDAATADTADGTGLANNDFIPDAQNVSSCVGTNEGPNCGSKAKGGLHLYLVFAALAGGVGFIGWRVSRSIRARDAVVNDIASRE